MNMRAVLLSLVVVGMLVMTGGSLAHSGGSQTGKIKLNPRTIIEVAFRPGVRATPSPQPGVRSQRKRQATPDLETDVATPLPTVLKSSSNDTVFYSTDGGEMIRLVAPATQMSMIQLGNADFGYILDGKTGKYHWVFFTHNHPFTPAPPTNSSTATFWELVLGDGTTIITPTQPADCTSSC